MNLAMNISLTAASYLAAALSFSFLGISLLVSWRGQYRGALLTLACFITAIWALLNAFANAGMAVPVAAMEVIRSAVWLLFIWEVLAGAKGIVISQLYAFRAALVSVFFLLLALTVYVHSTPSDLALFDIMGHVILAILGMVLVEQLFRNTHPDSRWGIKFVCLGTGAMFAYDFFLYSDAMLFHHIDPDIWMARGVVNAIVSPLIMVSAARNPQWSLRVHMSRHVVFHTATLLGAGVYLLLMAAVGYYIRLFGGTWGSVLQIAFFFGASILLLTIFFSGSMRARLRVLLNKHFFSSKYDYREEWLRFTRTLLTSEGQIYEAAIRAIAVLVESPAGALWLAREPGAAYACVAHWNMSVSDHTVPVDDPVVLFMADSQWVVNLDEYRPDRERYGDLEMPVWLIQIKDAWIVVPLMLQERLLGFIVLAQPRSDIHFNWEVSDLLKTAAHQLANHLAQKQATDALLVARQFDSFNRMSAFVVHDLKNLVAQLSLMLSNAEKHRDNPEFQEDMLSTVQNSVDRMNRLLSQLRSGGGSTMTEVALFGLLQSVLEAKAALKPRPLLKAEDESLHVKADAEKLARVIGHIVQNACEATRYDGRVDVRLYNRGKFAVIEVEDNGKGMDEDFIRDRLFRPFDSTKNSGMGIGAYECQEYIRELGGFVEVKSIPDQGTLFRVFIPLSNNA